MKERVNKTLQSAAPETPAVAPGERVRWKGSVLLAPVPAVLVSVGSGEEANLITIAWTGIVNSHPPMTYISVRPERHSYELLKKSGEFVIHLPARAQAKALDYCGVYTGAKVNKFEKCRLTKIPSETVGCPTVAECPVALECRVTEEKPLGSHTMFLAEILSVSLRQELLDEEGKLHLEKAGLLAYAHGVYHALGGRIGAFGFSAVKRKRGGRPAKGGGRS